MSNEISLSNIIPGDGWRAVYVSEGDTWEALKIVPIVCFALIADLETDEGELVGMVPEGTQIVPCMSPTFIGYLARDKNVDVMIPLLVEWKKRQDEKEEKERLEKEIREERMKLKWS